ncbi:Arc family DNA-binding protein [Acetobacter fabarum]|uniref:Arc family DNA-binding protein n=1 Tax=Acetobacter fabarum TaxID=483199 RepID=UPI0039E8E6F4
MSRSSPQVRFRPPLELQEQILRSAVSNRRSMNSEIVLILERHYAETKKASEHGLGNRSDASHAE